MTGWWIGTFFIPTYWELTFIFFIFFRGVETNHQPDEHLPFLDHFPGGSSWISIVVCIFTGGVFLGLNVAGLVLWYRQGRWV
jgi:hypothetical protein